MFDTQTTDEFGNTQYIKTGYCECEESVSEEIDGVWYCENCGKEIDYEPDVDLLNEQYEEDQMERELDSWS